MTVRSSSGFQLRTRQEDDLKTEGPPFGPGSGPSKKLGLARPGKASRIDTSHACQIHRTTRSFPQPTHQAPVPFFDAQAGAIDDKAGARMGAIGDHQEPGGNIHAEPESLSDQEVMTAGDGEKGPSDGPLYWAMRGSITCKNTRKASDYSPMRNRRVEQISSPGRIPFFRVTAGIRFLTMSPPNFDSGRHQRL